MGLNVPIQHFPYCFKMLTSKHPEWGEEMKRFYSQTPHIMLHERVGPFGSAVLIGFVLSF